MNSTKIKHTIIQPGRYHWVGTGTILVPGIGDNPPLTVKWLYVLLSEVAICAIVVLTVERDGKWPCLVALHVWKPFESVAEGGLTCFLFFLFPIKYFNPVHTFFHFGLIHVVRKPNVVLLCGQIQYLETTLRLLIIVRIVTFTEPSVLIVNEGGRQPFSHAATILDSSGSSCVCLHSAERWTCIWVSYIYYCHEYILPFLNIREMHFTLALR